ncbi:hypothetical protein ABZU86_24335, partial [Streptomyces sp. NPDC005271]
LGEWAATVRELRHAILTVTGAAGAAGPPAEVPGYEVHRRQLTVTGPFSHEPDDWRAATEPLRGGELTGPLATLITARYALDEVEKALQQAAETPVYRVVVTP